jgi:NADH-quinone oxidoreductase subunit L
VGDVGFFIGILLLYWKTGTLNLYTADGTGALQHAAIAKLIAEPYFWGLTAAGFIALMLFIGAMGKSAQFPLHVWLPDAMEGPTPVSALIHAATMVAAGVFMVGRMFPVFTASAGDWVMDFVMWVGCITAVFSATIAVAQFDIKRVLAYSTCSQLGFMVMALGAGGLAAGQFHLLTHAFFKALLFLGSGCVIIGTHHEQDMRKMGGLKKYMPITFWCYFIGYLALAGFPLTAGFFSKDEVLLQTFHHNKLAWGLATFAAFLTAFYMTRQMFMVFAGKWRGGDSGHGHGHDDHGHGHGHGGHEPHEVPWNMWLPIVILSVFALFMGWLGTPWLKGNMFHHYVAPHEEAPHHSNLVLWLSIGVGLFGIFLGWLIYGRKTLAHATDADPLQAKLGALFTVLNRKWYVDEFYEATVIRWTMACGTLFRAFDKLVIDGVLHAIAGITKAISQVCRWIGDELLINGGFDASCEGVRGSGSLLSKIQSGKVQNYFAFLSVGTIILVVVYFLKQ